MGTEFIPSLDEGDIAMHALRIPGTASTKRSHAEEARRSVIRSLPEVDRVSAKLGTADIATDPMPPSMADTFVMLKPRSDWPDPRSTKTELVARLERAVTDVPGNDYEFTQPIQMRFNELISGVRSDLAVKIYGDDLDQLLLLGKQVERALLGVSGAADVKVEQTNRPAGYDDPCAATTFAGALRPERRRRAGYAGRLPSAATSWPGL